MSPTRNPNGATRDNPYCSASPATDGAHVFVSYGSAGVACYDFAGKEIWHRELGAIDHEWGNSTSPVLSGDLCIHYHGPGKGGFLVGLSKKTGETVWRIDEPAWQTGKRTDGFRDRDGPGVIGSFSTPILIEAGGAQGAGDVLPDGAAQLRSSHGRGAVALRRLEPARLHFPHPRRRDHRCHGWLPRQFDRRQGRRQR